jgi:formylglycine-generating enzyme required for sulfatase activity
MRQILIILSMFCVFVGKAQDVSVTSFSLDEFDLTANVQGPASGQERVYRGGSWWYYGKSCRVSRRNSGKPDTKSAMVGLRLAMSANQ